MRVRCNFFDRTSFKRGQATSGLVVPEAFQHWAASGSRAKRDTHHSASSLGSIRPVLVLGALRLQVTIIVQNPGISKQTDTIVSPPNS